MVPFVAFDSMNNWMGMEYERNHRSFLKAFWKGTVRISAKAYSHYNSKMVQMVGVVEPWKVTLLKLNGYKLEQVWESPEYTNTGNWLDIPTLTLPDGIYYLSSTGANTLTEMVMIRNNKELIPPPTHIAIFPAYMFSEWGCGPLKEPAIIRWQGVRSPRMSCVPLGPSKALTTRLPRDKLWHQTVTLATQQKQFVRVPVVMPWGGIMLHHPMRYGVENWADLNPVHTIEGGQVTFSPSEDADGYPMDSGIGVVSSGYQHPETLEWICLNPMGRIVSIDRNHKMTTLYGPTRKQRIPHPRRWDLCPTDGERNEFMSKHYDTMGSGPDIWRAWSICPNIDNANIVYVAVAGTHTINRVDLRTGVGSYVAGVPNTRGTDETHFDQPRGVLMLSQGPHAGKLLVLDEHNSRVGVVNLTTGFYQTLFQAKRVPQNPSVELGNKLPMDLKDGAGLVTRTGLRAQWGMTGVKGSVQKLDSPDLQFVHPCSAAEMSDGRIVMAHHDEYRISIVDFVEGTLTYFHDFPLLGSRTDALPRAWPSVFVDKLGAFGGKDDIFGACWFQSSEQWLDKTGKRFNLTAGGFMTAEGPGELCRQFAYARALIPGVNGELLYSGDDANGTHVIRARLPNDPKLDQPRFTRGQEVYGREATRPDGSKRAAFRLNHGPALQNYWAGYKCAADLAELTSEEFSDYWRKSRGASDLTDEQMSDFLYWSLWQSAEGVQQLREGRLV